MHLQVSVVPTRLGDGSQSGRIRDSMTYGNGDMAM
jgi:hypothetical protein